MKGDIGPGRYIGCVKDIVEFLHDSIFRQVAELHVTKGLPWADHCDVCAKTLHAGDVVSESRKKEKKKNKILVLTFCLSFVCGLMIHFVTFCWEVTKIFTVVQM